MPPRRDRGEYRPIYEALLDGPQFQALDAGTRLVLIALKLKAGPLGIRVLPGLRESLGEWTGLRPSEIRKSLDALVSAEWIRIEQSVVWVVRGLEFEPTLTQSNPKMRSYIQRQCDALPSLGIVAQFRARYADWFREPSVPPPDTHSHTPPDTHSEGDAIPHRSTSPAPAPAPAPAAAAAGGGERGESEVEALLSRLEPSPRAVVERFLDAAPPGQRRGLALLLSGWTLGQGYASGRCASPDDIAAGLSDYLGQERSHLTFKPKAIRSYVEDVERRRTTSPGGLGTRSGHALSVEHAGRARELEQLVVEHSLGLLNGVQLDQKLEQLKDEGTLDSATCAEIKALQPLGDIARARSREDGRRLVAERYARLTQRPSLQVIA